MSSLAHFVAAWSALYSIRRRCARSSPSCTSPGSSAAEGRRSPPIAHAPRNPAWRTRRPPATRQHPSDASHRRFRARRGDRQRPAAVRGRRRHLRGVEGLLAEDGDGGGLMINGAVLVRVGQPARCRRARAADAPLGGGDEPVRCGSSSRSPVRGCRTSDAAPGITYRHAPSNATDRARRRCRTPPPHFPGGRMFRGVLAMLGLPRMHWRRR